MIQKQFNMQFALLSGLCAALASVFGKVSGLPTLEDLWLVRGGCVSVMVACNAAVWTCYVKALHASDSTLSVTLQVTVYNYVFSALAGILLFEEAMSLLWWTGISLVLCGLVLIVRDEQNTSPDVTKKST